MEGTRVIFALKTANCLELAKEFLEKNLLICPVVGEGLLKPSDSDRRR
jgi:hypothetical protein